MSRHHQRLNRRQWAACRKAALDRDGWRCTECRRAGRLEVHHVVKLQDGGDEYDLANLVTLCRPCHFAAHRRRVTRAEAGWQALVTDLQA